jgi:hypothetical protein
MALKNKIKAILEEQAYHKLIELDKRGKGVFRGLVSLSYDKTDVLCWRAIEAMGLFSADLTKVDSEETMLTVRKLLWYLSEETGGVAWSAPEMLGEIIRNNRKLCGHIASIVINLDEPPFKKGVIWATGRIGEKYPELVNSMIPQLIEDTKDPDPQVRGFAALSLGLLRAKEAIPAIKALLNDQAIIKCYMNGHLIDKSALSLAEEAMTQILK